MLRDATADGAILRGDAATVAAGGGEGGADGVGVAVVFAVTATCADAAALAVSEALLPGAETECLETASAIVLAVFSTEAKISLASISRV